MTSLPSRRLALFFMAPAVVITACGGGGDAGKIKDLVKSIDKDPTVLCDNATSKLLQQVGGTAQKCKQAARAYPNDGSVKGDINVKVNGDTATAEFDTTKGDRTKVTFVKQDGDWKVDSTN